MSGRSRAARRRRAVWIFLARVIVAAATLTSASAAILTLRHGDLMGLLSVGFLLMQPILYRAMIYGL